MFGFWRPLWTQVVVQQAKTKWNQFGICQDFICVALHTVSRKLWRSYSMYGDITNVASTHLLLPTYSKCIEFICTFCFQRSDLKDSLCVRPGVLGFSQGRVRCPERRSAPPHADRVPLR